MHRHCEPSTHVIEPTIHNALVGGENDTRIDLVQPEPSPACATPDSEISSNAAERAATKTAAKIWLQLYHKRETAARITKNLKSNQAGYAERVDGVMGGAYNMQPAA